jgi:UDP-N-acetylglucosamine 2-epimerase (non-hydrolysing)
LASPFPEEANRSLLARIATRHFAPTDTARQALLNEGISDEHIDVTGNTVVDAIEMARQLMASKPLSHELDILLKHADGKPLVLITCHRRENFGGPLESICLLLKRLSDRYSDYYWVFPVHLNPNVQEPVQRILAELPNLSLLQPVDYLTNLGLIALAALIVSDSGGIQEEAPSFGVPVVVMRSHTERQEGIDAGFATLAGQAVESIEAAVVDWLDNPERRVALKNRPNPYGDGYASQRIVKQLIESVSEAKNG